MFNYRLSKYETLDKTRCNLQKRTFFPQPLSALENNHCRLVFDNPPKLGEKVRHSVEFTIGWCLA